MAKNDNLGDFLKSIANKLRSKLGTTDKINPQDFESKVDEVYEKCDEDFWRRFQKVINNKAERVFYNSAFINWYAGKIKPKFAVENAKTDWRQTFYGNTRLANLDFSNWTYETSGTAQTDSMFYNCQSLTSLDWNTHFKFAPVSASKMFLNCSHLHTLNGFNIGSLQTATDMFKGCVALKNITFEGTIKDSLNFSACPLSADSMQNIFSHLDTGVAPDLRTITIKQIVKDSYITKYGETEWNNNITLYTGPIAGWSFVIN